MGRILCLLGKAGVGKDTLAAGLLKNKKATKAVSYTTRPKRDGEIEGEDYYFISNEQFLKMKYNGEFLEETSYIVNGETWYYGFAKKTFENFKGTLIAVINPRGLEEIIKYPHLKKQLFVIHMKANESVRKARYFEREKDLDEELKSKRWSARVIQDEKDFANVQNLLVKNRIDNTTLWTTFLSVDDMVRTLSWFVQNNLE